MALRLYAAADEVYWAVKLSLLWTIGTLAGGVVLGVGPATLAAYTIARRHAAGETGSSFVRAYRVEFRRGSAVVLPIAAAMTLLVINYHWLTDRAAKNTTLAALALLAVIAAHLLPMAVHYDLRTPALLPKASLFALLRLPASVLLLFTAVAIGYAVIAYPVLLVVAVGGWIQLNTWLCLRLFAENEALRNARGIT
ncbi:DUF624 domain-containing protein [Actinoplanes sp. NPDC026619]|uniref:YesL family protein n=1 Tax=Actinoplanes sp. NPDC026619 TaxID=3155798 RepID=UPI0033D5E534